MPGHEVQDRFSLAYHAEVAARVQRDPAIVEEARRRLERWVESGALHPTYATAWRQLLALPTEQICKRLVVGGDRMQALRQVSPFAGTLTQSERRALRRALREATPQ
jgi:ATP-dependent helicase YprA (DUF1998 family)